MNEKKVNILLAIYIPLLASFVTIDISNILIPSNMLDTFFGNIIALFLIYFLTTYNYICIQ